MKARRRRPYTTRAPSRLGSHFTRQGATKNAYRTEREAQAAAQLQWTLNRAELNVYRCDYCHQWHMGNAVRNE